MGNWFGREDTDKVIDEMIADRRGHPCGREGLTICEALDTAIETLRKAEYPPCSDIADMTLIREQRFGNMPNFTPEAMRKVREQLDAQIDRDDKIDRVGAVAATREKKGA